MKQTPIDFALSLQRQAVAAIEHHPKEARRLIEQALSSLEPDESNETIYAKLLMTKGQLQCFFGEYAEALKAEDLKTIQRSLEIYKKHKSEDGVATALNGLGIVYGHLGEFANALAFYYESLAIRKKMNDEKNIFAALNNIAVTQEKQGQYLDALETIQKSHRAAVNLKNEELFISSFINMGNVLAKIGRFNEARESFERSLALAKKHRDKLTEANVMNNLGNVQLSLGNYEQAIHFFKESIRLNEELENKHGLVESLVSIGQCVARIRANKASVTLD